MDTEKFHPLKSPTGGTLQRYNTSILKQIENREVLNGIIRGYLADPSKISLYPIDPKDLVSDLHKNMFTVMNLISLRGLKMVDKAKIEDILNEPELDVTCKASPSAMDNLKRVLWGQYDQVALDKQGAIDNLQAYYNIESKYFTLRELYKRGADISDFFIPDSETGILNEAEIREQARANLENNTAEEIHAIITKGIQSAPTMRRRNHIPLLRDRELPHAHDEVKWLVDGVIKERSFNSIIGAAKAGKSQLAMQLSFCIKNGIDFLDKYKVEPSEVLYVDFELEDNDIMYRYDLLRQKYGLPEDTPSPYVFNMKNQFVAGSVDMEFITSEIKEYKREHPEIKFVVFDCYYTFSHGDSNSEEDVWKTLQPLKALSGADNDLTVLYVHHTNKSGVNSNNAIYASGGSGVHGKVIDTSIVIYPYTTGREHTVVQDAFYITAIGRSGGFSAKTIYDRSEKNGFFFFPTDEYDLGVTNSLTETEFKTKFPNTYDLFQESKKPYIAYYSDKNKSYATSDWANIVVPEFEKQGLKPEKYIMANKSTHRAFLPKFLVEIDEEQEASNKAAERLAKDIKDTVDENKLH